MKQAIRAIETEYAGYRFRSRTEARWAHLFDTLNVPYVYEPEGYEMDGVRYLPDFWLSGLKVWVEIKGEAPTTDEREKAERLHCGHGAPVIIIAGIPGGEQIWAYLTDSSNSGGGCDWWDGVLAATCDYCGAFDFNYGEQPDRVLFNLDWTPITRGCAHSPQFLDGRSLRIRRAVEAARSCRFERLPKNLRRALGVA